MRKLQGSLPVLKRHIHWIFDVSTYYPMNIYEHSVVGDVTLTQKNDRDLTFKPTQRLHSTSELKTNEWTGVCAPWPVCLYNGPYFVTTGLLKITFSSTAIRYVKNHTQKLENGLSYKTRDCLPTICTHALALKSARKHLVPLSHHILFFCHTECKKELLPFMKKEFVTSVVICRSVVSHKFASRWWLVC